MDESQDRPVAYRTCIACGGKVVAVPYEYAVKVGRVEVVDKTRLAEQCEGCGWLVSDAQRSSFLRRAAMALLQHRNVDGEVYRFAREAMNLNQHELAAFLDCNSATICRRECGVRKFIETDRLALLALVEGVDRHDGSLERYRSERARLDETTVAVSRPYSVKVHYLPLYSTGSTSRVGLSDVIDEH